MKMEEVEQEKDVEVPPVDEVYEAEWRKAIRLEKWLMPILKWMLWIGVYASIAIMLYAQARGGR